MPGPSECIRVVEDRGFYFRAEITGGGAEHPECAMYHRLFGTRKFEALLRAISLCSKISGIAIAGENLHTDGRPLGHGSS